MEKTTIKKLCELINGIADSGVMLDEEIKLYQEIMQEYADAVKQTGKTDSAEIDYESDEYKIGYAEGYTRGRHDEWKFVEWLF